MITISDGILTIPEGERFVGFSGDNLHTQKKFFIRSTPESGWLYRLYLTFDDGRHNFFTLSKEEVKDGTFLVWNIEEGHILKSGLVKAQIKAFSSDNEVYHTTSDVFVAGKTAEEDQEFLNSNSEFLSLEKRLNQLYGKMETASAKMPYVGSNGNWFTYDVNSGTYKDSGTSAVVSLDGVKITPDMLDREYWQKLERINVTGYDYFDSIISEKNALNTIYRVEFSGLSPIKTVTGDGSFVGVVSFDRDALLIMNISNGDRWIYKKDSNTLTKPEAYINNKSVTPEKLDRTYWEYAKSSFVGTASGLLNMLTEENKVMRIKALKDSSMYYWLGDDDALALKTNEGFFVINLCNGKKYKFDPEGGALEEVESVNASDSVVSAGTFSTLYDLKAYYFEENKLYKIFTPTSSELANLLGASYGQYWKCIYWIDRSDGDINYLTLYSLDDGKSGTLALSDGKYRGHIDQTYNPESENAQSGKAVAEALKNANIATAMEIYNPADFNTILIHANLNDCYRNILVLYLSEDLVDKKTNATLPSGTYFAFASDTEKVVCMSLTNTILYSIKKIDYINEDTGEIEHHAESITSSRDISDVGNYFTDKTIDGALQEIGSQLDGLETLLAGI